MSDLSPSLGRWRRRRRLRMHTIPEPIQRLRGLESLHSPLTALSHRVAAAPAPARTHLWCVCMMHGNPQLTLSQRVAIAGSSITMLLDACLLAR